MFWYYFTGFCKFFTGVSIILPSGKMKRYSQHTACLLLLFFGYSILFQNLHILLHDHGDYNSNCSSESAHSRTAHFCISDKGCGHSSGGTDQDNYPDHPKQPGINNSDHNTHKAIHCPVCEHEFAKFSFTKVFNIDFSAEGIEFVTSCHYQAPRILYKGNHISLRAPPSVV